jgi:hypothetical protein
LPLTFLTRDVSVRSPSVERDTLRRNSKLERNRKKIKFC